MSKKKKERTLARRAKKAELARQCLVEYFQARGKEEAKALQEGGEKSKNNMRYCMVWLLMVVWMMQWWLIWWWLIGRHEQQHPQTFEEEEEEAATFKSSPDRSNTIIPALECISVATSTSSEEEEEDDALFLSSCADDYYSYGEKDGVLKEDGPVMINGKRRGGYNNNDDKDNDLLVMVTTSDDATDDDDENVTNALSHFFLPLLRKEGACHHGYWSLQRFMLANNKNRMTAARMEILVRVVNQVITVGNDTEATYEKKCEALLRILLYNNHPEMLLETTATTCSAAMQQVMVCMGTQQLREGNLRAAGFTAGAILLLECLEDICASSVVDATLLAEMEEMLGTMDCIYSIFFKEEDPSSDDKFVREQARKDMQTFRDVSHCDPRSVTLFFSERASCDCLTIIKDEKKRRRNKHIKHTDKMGHCTHCHQEQPYYTGLAECSQCRIAHYCSRDCQMQDWANHKVICKKIAKHTISETTSHCAHCRKERAATCMWTCSRCLHAHYCSEECQTKDWKNHRTSCQAIEKKFATFI